jgi:pumilio homology domain family member 6
VLSQAAILMPFILDKTAAIMALLAPLSRPYPTPVPSNGELMHLIDIPHSSRLFKTLIQGGHFDRSTSSVQVVSSFSPSSFASQFMQVVGRENMVRMALGNGAFVVAELVKRVSEEGTETEKSELKGWFDKNVVSNIRVGQGRGSEALVGMLEGFQ